VSGIRDWLIVYILVRCRWVL